MAKTVAKKKASGKSSLLDWLSENSITLNAVVYDEANPVSPGEGDDLITGTAGDDQIDGLAGDFDTVSYENAKKVTVDLEAGTASGEGKDTLVNVENVIGSAWGSDSIKGDLNNNMLDGWGGNDKLWGGAGDDILFGGDGNDKLWGDDGADTLYGDAGNDHLFGGEGDDVLYGGDRNDQLNGDAGNDTLYGGDGNDKLVGGAGDDVLYGDKGNDQLRGGDGNDTLYAGAGNDVMFGGAGDDTYYVESAKDKVNEKAGEGNDTVVASYSFSLEKVKNVENLTLSEDATPLHIDATGNSLDNVLIGNSGNNTLNGKAGSDTLFGGEGNDIFVFDNLDGIDTVEDFTAGSDLLQLNAKVFASLAGQVQEGNLVLGDVALDADDFLIFDSVTGTLSYDADGNGAGEAVKIAILGVPELQAGDFMVV